MTNNRKFNDDVSLAIGNIVKRLIRIEQKLNLEHTTTNVTTKNIERLIEISKEPEIG